MHRYDQFDLAIWLALQLEHQNQHLDLQIEHLPLHILPVNLPFPEPLPEQFLSLFYWDLTPVPAVNNQKLPPFGHLYPLYNPDPPPL